MGNNIPAYQLKQFIKHTSFAYANNTDDDTFNWTLELQHYYENQQHLIMSSSGTDHNHLLA